MSQQIESAGAVAASGGSAVAAIITTTLNVGLPLPSMLAAFAGASLILSFLPTAQEDGKRRTRMLATVVFCTILGTLFGPAASAWLGMAGLAALGVAFAIGSLGQVVIPVVIERRKEMFDWFMALLPRRGGQ